MKLTSSNFLFQQKLAGSKVQGRTLSVSDVKSRPWEENGKLEENEESEDEEGELGASKEGDNPPEPVKEVWQAVTPLANIPYKDQLELKKEGVAKELRKFVIVVSFQGIFRFLSPH